ncbi:MAG: zinc ribbon domain-containing protein [Syntrophotalea acetylenica]|uniref:Transcriptional regulator n=1 Tax=Syntrophotalea acetylenica TaxID=29542 RepID=A0A1L3GGI1_SYNAC|nr:zinc ribbon domain-containing protein [Syntrophotalea acetylenica]APG25073.1 transcriptional regulator [Syntrophotalea acetylenica]APG43144.1 transcriptional regulator [Syntrophotalea acetylenica]MDD4456673.1 zinc ribbon domain-containing protein [Syntrophotalea acetylenica]MDY0260932.1 zinc ribbon domain-containing protein [Syntrophotalea acetylenica]
MPMYEYRCDACGLVFEARQKFSDAPLSQCPECKGPVHKLISQSAFALKGGGWYNQGYSSSGKPAACSAGGTEASCAGCPKAASNA